MSAIRTYDAEGRPGWRVIDDGATPYRGRRYITGALVSEAPVAPRTMFPATTPSRRAQMAAWKLERRRAAEAEASRRYRERQR